MHLVRAGSNRWYWYRLASSQVHSARAGSSENDRMDVGRAAAETPKRISLKRAPTDWWCRYRFEGTEVHLARGGSGKNDRLYIGRAAA
jgi:hypothetical protein